MTAVFSDGRPLPGKPQQRRTGQQGGVQRKSGIVGLEPGAVPPGVVPVRKAGPQPIEEGGDLPPKYGKILRAHIRFRPHHIPPAQHRDGGLSGQGGDLRAVIEQGGRLLKGDGTGTAIGPAMSRVRVSTRSWAIMRVSWEKARILPVMVSRSGAKFSGVPAWMEHTAHTSGSSGAALRLTMD